MKKIISLALILTCSLCLVSCRKSAKSYNEEGLEALSSKKVESISKNVDLTGAGLMSINDGAVYFGDRTGKNVIAFEKGKTKSYAMPKGALPPYSITLL